MSAEYDAYLSEHISNVQKAAQWMADNISYIITNDAETITVWTNLLEEVQYHDRSKYDHAEYDAYDYHFYGGGKDDATDVAFDFAWLHHQKKNPHHWQYWVLLKDEGEIVSLDMPLVYILEMIADWWSFSWKNGNLMEIFGWYNEHRDKMRLSLSTRIQVELILGEIYDVLVTQLKKENPSFDPASIIEHSSIKKDDDKEYGVPEQKKFPLPDADHVRSAIRFFNYVDPKYEQELADAINEKIAEYQMAGIHVGDENKFKKYVKEEYLEHHGILGQKWGQRNGPPYPLKEGDHSKEEQKLQGLQNLSGAKTANMEKWGADEDHNVLYIAGYSGSGKSTTALALKKPGDSVIHLDVYTEPDHDASDGNWRDKDFNKYLDKHVPNWDALQKATKDGEGVYKRHSKEYWNIVDQFDKAIDSFSKEKYKNNERVVVEGVQIADNWLKGSNEDYAGKPIIILQNGPIKSMSRAFERDDRGNLFQGLKNLDNAKEYAGWYYQMYKNLDGLANATGAKKHAYNYDEDHLEHHGILGQKWGIRRYQNPDGTLTEEGIYHYRKVRANQRKEDIDSVYNRLSKKEKALIGDDENAKEYLSTDEGEYVVKRLVDRSDDKPVAFLDMMTSTKPGELIVTVATDPDYRGQGRAEKLARKGVKWFDKNGAKYGFKYLDWGFYEENKASQKVAEKVGFKFFKQNDDWIVYRYTTDPNIKHDDFDDEEDDDILEHHGVMGQKWGIQNGPPYPIGSGGVADRSHYNNHTVFVSGSSKTTTEDSGYYRKDLPESIQNELKRHMHEGNKIIVGDAPGIDRQVQDFLNENDYYNVEVYGPGKKVRYSANELWKTNPIDAPEYEEGSKEWLAKKDIAMSKAANEGLAIILDEGATATRKNVRRLADDDKDVKVFSLGADGNDNWIPKKMLKEI